MKMSGLVILKVKFSFCMGHTASILILDITIDDTDFILVNIYNANTETEQIKVLNNLHYLLNRLDIHHDKKKIILAGDFNIFLTFGCFSVVSAC